jgi:hypothetical protein
MTLGEAFMKLIGMLVPFAIGLIVAAAYIAAIHSGRTQRSAAPRVLQEDVASTRPLSLRSPPSPLADPQASPTRKDSASSVREAAEPRGALREPPAGAAERARIETLKRRMAENLYRRAGGFFAGRFAARGLAPADAKAIIRSYFGDIAECVFEAAQQEAEAHSITRDEFLAKLEQDLTTAKADSSRYRLSSVAGLDSDVIEARAEPCVLDASQEAGIPFR